MSPSSATLEGRALALIEDALALAPGEREGFINERAGDDPVLRARARALLAAAERSSGALATGGAGAAAAEPAPPKRIGAYRIIELVGRGGMGAVYRGERDQGDFRHTVAIKLIRSDAASAALTERFARERQTLADLAHPNIARLFDGGQTAEGQPFIVMEFVEGRPITLWADDRGLDTRARLGLFQAACEAVRYAHQNLVVHRDITPSNVLVTADGTVKLIDFGIARPPEADGAVRPSEASVGALTLTPGFAAPERLAGASGSTLVDVFSLGRLLEQLLERQSPDPDLQAVVARASAPGPEDRYPSVDALMADVRRRLTGHPVVARGGGRRYAFRKFVGRHRRAVGAGAAALTVILGALVLTALAYREAEAARIAEAQRFDQVRRLAGYMLFDLNDRLERTPGNTQARVELAAEAQRYLAALADDPDAAPAVRMETARGFIRLAQIQGVPPAPNFGEREKAKASLTSAAGLLDAMADVPGRATAVVAERARVDALRAVLVGHGDSDTEQASRLLADASARLTAVPAPERDEAWHQARRTLRGSQADVAGLRDDLDDLGRIAGRMEADIAEWPPAMRNSPLAEEDRAVSLYWRGAERSYRDEGDRGTALLLEAGRRMRAVEAGRRNDPRLLYWLAYIDYELFAGAAQAGQDAVSSAAIERARATLDRLLAVEDGDNALKTLKTNVDEAYAQDLSNRGRHADAIAAQKAVVAAQLGKLTPEKRANALGSLAWSQMILGVTGRKAGDRALACEGWTEAEARFAELERREELLGFQAGFLPGLRANLKLCREGAPLSAFGPLR